MVWRASATITRSLLRAGPLERQGPDPEGAALRLDNGEGNHGEDVKEYYFYLDSTPTHSYMKYLYKYPQAAFPYARLVEDEPAARPQASPSTSCSTPASSTKTATSTSFVEYAKAGAEDILIKISVVQPRT